MLSFKISQGKDTAPTSFHDSYHSLTPPTPPTQLSVLFKNILMGLSAEQHRIRVGCFNNVYVSRLQTRTRFNNSKDTDSTLNKNRLSTNLQKPKLGPIHLSLAYLYLVMISLIISMMIDLKGHNQSLTHTVTNATISPVNITPPLRNLLNWAIITILFLIKAPFKNSCVFNIMRKKNKLRKVSFVNFWYLMFFRNRTTSLFYITLINLLLIVITNPCIVNPGPVNRKRPLTLFYNNVQGLVNISSLKSKTPILNKTKSYELQAYIYKHKPDIVVLNETWLKPCILNSEILPQNYKIFRADRSNKTHPTDPHNPKKFRECGGGVLIAHRTDIDLESSEVGLKKVQAEILTVRMKLPSDKILCVSTFYRVGNLGIENYEKVKDYLVTLACKKRLDKHVIIGDFNFPEISWPDTTTSVELHRKFLQLLNVDLGHNQLINRPTHKSGNILDLLFTNISELITDVTVMGYKEACTSDHYALNCKIKLDISQKKVP